MKDPIVGDKIIFIREDWSYVSKGRTGTILRVGTADILTDDIFYTIQVDGFAENSDKVIVPKEMFITNSEYRDEKLKSIL
jgi:hypothetical protein